MLELACGGHGTLYTARSTPVAAYQPASQPAPCILLAAGLEGGRPALHLSTCYTAATELPICILVCRERALRKDGSEKEEAPREERERRRERSRLAGLGVEWLVVGKLYGAGTAAPLCRLAGRTGAEWLWNGLVQVPHAHCSLSLISWPLGRAAAVVST